MGGGKVPKGHQDLREGREKKAHERDGGGGNREAEAIPGVSTVPQVNKEASLDERSRATYNELLSSRKY